MHRPASRDSFRDSDAEALQPKNQSSSNPMGRNVAFLCRPVSGLNPDSTGYAKGVAEQSLILDLSGPRVTLKLPGGTLNSSLVPPFPIKGALAFDSSASRGSGTGS